MNDTGLPARVWRRDQGAMLTGVCAGLSEDLDLPLPLVRIVTVVFLVLPTGLAYLALSLLLRRRPIRQPSRLGVSRPRPGQTDPRPTPLPNFALLAHRFEVLEPKLKRIEAFVTSSDFELHRGFRRMDEQEGVLRPDQRPGQHPSQRMDK